MDELAVLERLKTLGPSTLAEVASELGASPTAVNRCLESLRSRQLVKRSPKGKWFVPGFMRGQKSSVLSAGPHAPFEQIIALAAYARHCAYEEEDGSTALDASSLGRSWLFWPEAREWSAAGGEPRRLDVSAGFCDAVRAAGPRLVYGYPTWLKRDGCGCSAIPILTQAVEVLEVHARSLRVAFADEYPQVNPAFLQEAFETSEDRRAFVEQMGLLGEEVEAGVSVGSCASRLVEDGLPYPLEWAGSPVGQPLELPINGFEDDGGVHNAAVLGLARGLKYRKSLAGELEAIAQIDKPSRFSATSLGAMFGLGPVASASPEIVVGEDLPLDGDQVGVVRYALGAPLTVVTGPPGTGKSQVVTSILANALLSGQSVLFASLNHKAVAVVEDKLNGIAGYRAILHMGNAREDRCHLLEVAAEVEELLGGVLSDDDGGERGSVGARLAAARADAIRSAGSEERASLEELAEAARSMGDGEWTAFPAWIHAFPEAAHVFPLWCVTNLSAKWSFPMTAGLFDLLVIDEASQCDIGSALPLMYRARQAVIIGDANQLRHVTSVSHERSRQLASQAGVPDSLFAKIDHSKRSLFDFAAQTVGEDALMSLTGHYRCHPDIVGFPNRQWYENMITVLTDSSSLPTPGSLPLGMYWLPIRSTVEPGSTGVTARDEAEIIVSRVQSLLTDDGFMGTVGVVTPFRAQRSLIEAMLDVQLEPAVRERARLITRTAHGFQGDERDVIFLSACLRPGINKGSHRFLKETDNLLNVAVTRARSTLVVVGDLDACRNCGISHYEALALYWDQLESVRARSVGRIGADRALFRRLLQWRRGRALLEGATPARVLPDDTLRAIALVRPRTEEELGAIKGIGLAKTAKYGSEVLEMVSLSDMKS